MGSLTKNRHTHENPFLAATKFYDWETGLYYYGYRYYNPSTGRWLSRDPIGERGGKNVYGFVNNQPLGRIDILGLAPSVCPCRPGQKDSKDYINNLIQNAIKAGGSAKGARQQIEALLIGGGAAASTGIEKLLANAIDNKLVDGEKCNCNYYYPNLTKARVPLPKISSAPSLRLCGQCVGTDKLGHFLEEGLAYYDIAQSKGEKYATAWGYWTEGILDPETSGQVYTWLLKGQVTYNLFGNVKTWNNSSLWGMSGDSITADSMKFITGSSWFPTTGGLGYSLDPNGSAGMADIAANESGLAFWKDLFSGSYTSGKIFNICDYVNAKWDHTTNPNVPGAFRGEPIPPLP